MGKVTQEVFNITNYLLQTYIALFCRHNLGIFYKIKSHPATDDFYFFMAKIYY